MELREDVSKVNFPDQKNRESLGLEAKLEIGKLTFGTPGIIGELQCDVISIRGKFSDARASVPEREREREEREESGEREEREERERRVESGEREEREKREGLCIQRLIGFQQKRPNPRAKVAVLSIKGAQERDVFRPHLGI